MVSTIFIVPDIKIPNLSHIYSDLLEYDGLSSLHWCFIFLSLVQFPYPPFWLSRGLPLCNLVKHDVIIIIT